MDSSETEGRLERETNLWTRRRLIKEYLLDASGRRSFDMDESLLRVRGYTTESSSRTERNSRVMVAFVQVGALGQWDPMALPGAWAFGEDAVSMGRVHELESLTAGWTSAVARLYPSTAVGRQWLSEEEAAMSAHGYVSLPSDLKQVGNVTAISVEYVPMGVIERRRAEAEAELETSEAAFYERFAGLPIRGEDHFECPRCGRWASTEEAASALRDTLTALSDLDVDQWIALRDAAVVGTIRPAWLERTFGVSYETATEALSAALAGGILAPKNKGLAAAAPMCASCRSDTGSANVASNAATGREPIPPQLRFRVLRRDAFRCQYCGRTAASGAQLHLDHVVPVAAGGDTTEANLITACDQCNLGKSSLEVL